MGATKIDIHKGERDWDNVNESSLESIKGMLKYRYKFDPIFNVNESMIKDVQNGEYSINYQAINTYATLDKHIEKANLTDTQLEVLDLYQRGITEQVIADELGKTQNTIYNILKTICKKIYNEAYEEWKDHINLEVIKTQYEYKECKRCMKWKPISIEYFSPDYRNKDGFHSFCRKCR